MNKYTNKLNPIGEADEIFCVREEFLITFNELE